MNSLYRVLIHSPKKRKRIAVLQNHKFLILMLNVQIGMRLNNFVKEINRRLSQNNFLNKKWFP